MKEGRKEGTIVRRVHLVGAVTYARRKKQQKEIKKPAKDGRKEGGNEGRREGQSDGFTWSEQ